MPAPAWFFRFMYDRESAAWGRRRDEVHHQELVEAMADQLASAVAAPGPVADIGCGPGAHAVALARRGFDVVGGDVSPRMVAVAVARAERDGVQVRLEVLDAGSPLPFEDAALGGVMAIHVVQHLHDPAAFLAEIERCLTPGGHLLITAPSRSTGSLPPQSLYWRLRAAFYTYVPGVVRFTDQESLTELLEEHGFSVVTCEADASRVSALARTATDADMG